MTIEITIRWGTASNKKEYIDNVNRLQQRVLSDSSIGKLVLDKNVEDVLYDTGASEIILDFIDIAESETYLRVTDYYREMLLFMRQRIVTFLANGWPSLRTDYVNAKLRDLQLGNYQIAEVYSYTTDIETNLKTAYKFMLQLVGFLNFLDTVKDCDNLRLEIVRSVEDGSSI